MQEMLNLVETRGSAGRPLTWTDVMKVARPDAEVWGRLSPQLQMPSNATGCSMFCTPQKYWPKGIAKRYFRYMSVFGLLRDPFERLVAHFRANLDSYGKLGDRCDANAAIKRMMKRYLERDNKFMENCAFLPQ